MLWIMWYGTNANKRYFSWQGTNLITSKNGKKMKIAGQYITPGKKEKKIIAK